MSKSILVLAASGTVGVPLVQELLRRGEKVKAASRSGKAIEGAEGVVLDLADPSTYAPVFEGVRAAYMMLPRGYFFDTEQAASLLHMAAERNVKIVLQTSADALYDHRSRHLSSESLVRKLGAPFVIVRPSWFMDNFHIFWRDDIANGELALPAGDARTAFIDARDIAASSAAALTSDAFNNQEFNLTGREAITYGEAAAVLAKAIGRPVVYRHVSASEYVEMLVRMGMPRPSAEFFAGILVMVREGVASTTYPGVEQLTKREPRTFAEYAKDNAWRFRKLG